MQTDMEVRLRTALGPNLVQLDIGDHLEKPSRFDPYTGFTVAVHGHTPIASSSLIFSPEYLCNGLLAIPLLNVGQGGLLAEAMAECSGGISGFTRARAQAISERLQKSTPLLDALTEASPWKAQDAGVFSHRFAFAGLFVGYDNGPRPWPFLVVQGTDSKEVEEFYDTFLEDPEPADTWASVFGSEEWTNVWKAAAQKRRKLAEAALSALNLTSDFSNAIESVTNVVLPVAKTSIYHYYANTTPVFIRSNGVLSASTESRAIRLIYNRDSTLGGRTLNGHWSPPPRAHMTDPVLPAMPYWDASSKPWPLHTDLRYNVTDTTVCRMVLRAVTVSHIC